LIDSNLAKRSGDPRREWTAIAPTEVRVVRELTLCLQEIGEGRMPK
jgi:hypothetical protein